jgi:hypothetical protein
MMDEIELLRDARPRAEGPSPETVGQARASLLAEIEAVRRPRRWSRRRLFRIAVPAVAAAAAAAVVAGITLPGGSGEQAWAAALVRVAEAAPRLLVDEPGWEVTRADQFSVDLGEMTLANGERELEIKWLPAGNYKHAVDTLVAEMDDLATTPVAGTQARVFRYPGTNDYVAVWLADEHTVEARGLAPDADAFKATLAALAEVDVDTWLSAMPASVVRPAAQAATVDEMLAGMPLPPDFDRTKIATSSAVRDRYQLGAQVAGAVACAWIDQWVAARRAGDEDGAREAVEAMATASSWPILQEMEEEGDYPKVLRQYATGMAGDGLVPAGKRLTVEESYEAALNCPAR